MIVRQWVNTDGGYVYYIVFGPILPLFRTEKEHQPFSPTQKESSMENYWSFALKMMVMAIRYTREDEGTWEIEMLLTENQKIRADSLYNTLERLSDLEDIEADDETEVFDEIFQLLVALYFEEHRETQISKANQSPMNVFILCLNLAQYGAGFTDAFLITPKLSAIQYCMRVIAIKYIVNRANELDMTPFE